MNMKMYWAKIVVTALAIFGVGLVVRKAFVATKRQVVQAVESNADVTIPLPFLPFNFDGAKVGSFRKLVIHRTDPKHVSGVDVSVRLADGSALDRLKGCQLTVDDPTKVNEHTSFRCATVDSTMEVFGQVFVQTKGDDGEWTQAAAIPLALPRDAAKSIRGEDAQAHAALLEADRFREIGDSLRVLGQALGKAQSDSIREALEENMGDLRDEMEELQGNISDAARARATPTAEEGARVGRAPAERASRPQTPAPARAPTPPKPQ